jgi:hypothetical protein
MPRKSEVWYISHPTKIDSKYKVNIDTHVLPICKLLWKNNIQTFYSCQGGPIGMNYERGELYYRRAYVIIPKVEAIHACDLISNLVPRIEDDLVTRKRVCIVFDPHPLARGSVSKKLYKILRDPYLTPDNDSIGIMKFSNKKAKRKDNVQ